jgi:putative nucleotidyltransferase with HDIG domain
MRLSVATVFDRERSAWASQLAGCRVVPLTLEALASGLPDDVDLVIVDIEAMDYGVIETLRQSLSTATAHRVVVVHGGKRAQLVQAKAIGADEVLQRPLLPEDIAACLDAQTLRCVNEERDPRRRVARLSLMAGARALTGLFESLSARQIADVAAIGQASRHIGTAIQEIGFADWVGTVRQHHSGTYQHCLIVTAVATMFGQKLGMKREDVERLTSAGLLHDIGKAEIPLLLLDKPGQLTDDEFRVMQTHPVIGHRHLATHRDIPAPVLHAVRHHHEYLDGSGYPDGLVALDLPDLTRILTVCDVYGALLEVRAYKPPMAPAEALAVLASMAAAGKLDKAVVHALELASAELGRIPAQQAA